MPNRLARETSPYLQQHADNPVDWHPWGEEALALARELDKPILLSIGYSACHWCHVMAHESFEDAEVAARMNELYVNIKVDREERPDLDQIYQTAHYLLTRRNGGWPLTLFLMPDTTPFFGGTYFPKQPRYNMPGFLDLLGRVEGVYRTRRADLESQNASLLAALRDAGAPRSAGPGEITAAPLGRARDDLARLFDARHGGLGRAPKFPHPYELGFLLERGAAGDAEAQRMAALTLTRMAEGGIHDQVGGGFCRYSVDESWTIPHFEKMLYDNGPLLALYADAWLATGDPLYRSVVEDTAGWVVREMQAPAGGYYSSLDADSEHEEGRFYVWTPSEVRAVLDPDEFAVAAPHWGLDGPPNFEERHWHLRVTRPLPDVALELGRTIEECVALLAAARAKLHAARERRVRPGRDEKILASWNALMIRGMARAARACARPDWLDSALRALAFVRSTLWRDGRLHATHKDGRTHLNAYLDDHAFLLDALLEVLQAGFRAEDLAFAREVADALLARFEDGEAGGFWFTSHDHERLIQRPRVGHDNATPSGNGVAAHALQRLGHLLGEVRYLTAAERTVRSFVPAMAEHASGFPSLLQAIAEHLDPPVVVILRGPREELSRWRRPLDRQYAPHRLVLAVPGDVKNLPPAVDKPVSDGVNAWVCHGVTCLAPIADPAELARVLQSGASPE